MKLLALSIVVLALAVVGAAVIVVTHHSRHCHYEGRVFKTQVCN